MLTGMQFPASFWSINTANHGVFDRCPCTSPPTAARCSKGERGGFLTGRRGAIHLVVNSEERPKFGDREAAWLGSCLVFGRVETAVM